MKIIIKAFLVTILTFICMYIPASWIHNFSLPYVVDIGPNTLHEIDQEASFTSSTSSPLTFRSLDYFELTQEGSSLPVQAILESPAVGDTVSYYWIRDLKIEGEWIVSKHSATVFNPTGNSTITKTLSTYEVSFFGVLVSLLFVVIWFFGLAIISR